MIINNKSIYFTTLKKECVGPLFATYDRSNNVNVSVVVQRLLLDLLSQKSN